MHSRLDLLDLPTNLTDFEKLFFGGIITLAIGTLFYWLNKRKDVKNSAMQEFAKVATMFRSAFTEDELFFKKSPTDTRTSPEIAFTNHLRARFSVHEDVMKKLRAVLPDSTQKAAFDNAWERYKYAGEHKNPNRHIWDGYEFHLYLKTIKDDKERRKVALKYLRKLLKFSDAKYVFNFKISNLYWFVRS